MKTYRIIAAGLISCLFAVLTALPSGSAEEAYPTLADEILRLKNMSEKLLEEARNPQDPPQTGMEKEREPLKSAVAEKKPPDPNVTVGEPNDWKVWLKEEETIGYDRVLIKDILDDFSARSGIPYEWNKDIPLPLIYKSVTIAPRKISREMALDMILGQSGLVWRVSDDRRIIIERLRSAVDPLTQTARRGQQARIFAYLLNRDDSYPDFPDEFLWNAAQTFAAGKDTQQAESFFLRLMRGAEHPVYAQKAYEAYARMLRERGDTENALALLIQYVEMFPESPSTPDALAALSDIAVPRKEYAKALDILKFADSVWEKDPIQQGNIRRSMARVLWNAGLTRDLAALCHETLNQPVSRDVERDLVYYLSKCFITESVSAEALPKIMEYLIRHPDDERAEEMALALAEQCRVSPPQTGKFLRYETFLAQLAPSAPWSFRVRLALARSYAEGGFFQKAREICLKIRDSGSIDQPRVPEEILEVLSFEIVKNGTNWMDDASREFFLNMAERCDPSALTLTSLYALADVLIAIGERIESEKILVSILSSSPSGDLAAKANRQLGYVYQKSGRWAEAVRRWQIALESGSAYFSAEESEDMLARSADCLFSLGRISESASLYTAFLERFPDSPRDPWIRERLKACEGDPKFSLLKAQPLALVGDL